MARLIKERKKRKQDRREAYENMSGVDSSCRLEFGIASLATCFVVLAGRTFAFGGLITSVTLAGLFRGPVFTRHHGQFGTECAFHLQPD